MSRPTERSFTLDHRRASAPAFAFARKNYDLNHNFQPCCHDSDMHRCGCTCRSCCCGIKPAQNNPKQHNYNEKQGQAITPGPLVAFTNSPFQPSSVSTSDSCFSAHEDISNSWEAQAPLSARMMADDFGRPQPAYGVEAAIHDVELAFASDDEDPNQWPEFTSPIESEPSSHHTDDDLEVMAGSSLFSCMDVDEPTEAGFQSVTASQYLVCTGTSFTGNNFLPLTPDCRHERTRQMCAHCMHY
ncbi:hypothetical protein B0A52_00276 [Exophiala mesophila]|uniref:Uncharacterized protein n=1 Tax=Exophiala mesophila TaxID=212818 RepID=A0A438NJL6_EXOME|nr:hypothetical protein B0A52_00276 [Exophiala mesophila]